MRRSLKELLLILLFLVLLQSCLSPRKMYDVVVIENGIRFCEGTVVNGNSVYFANYAGSNQNPLNTDGLGYVLEINEKGNKIIIPPIGDLNAPKGMGIKDNYLYIADVGCIMLYNLEDMGAKPLKLEFPAGNAFVNDIGIGGDFAYISVTNSGKVFKLDISNPSNLTKDMLVEYADVPGANGIIIDNNTMYIASCSLDGVVTDANVIYIIRDIKDPKVEKLFNHLGQYDGLALSANGDKLYFTNWVGGQVGYVDLTTGRDVLMDVNYTFVGPSDLILHDCKLYIPDLLQSVLLVVDLGDDC